jgi:hypothetical protein
VPIGITVGTPSKLWYPLAANLRELLRTHGRSTCSGSPSRGATEPKLDRLGVDQVQVLLQEAAGDAEGAILLCFEDLAKPDQWCNPDYLGSMVAGAYG